MRRIWLFLALAVAGVVVFLVARGMQSGERRAERAAPQNAPAKTTSGEASPEIALVPAEEPAAPGPEPLRGEWTITGRVVTERAAGSEDGSSALEPVREPVAGAAVRVRLAPPKEGEETPPPRAPREVVTGLDGRFLAASLPGKTPLEVEVDAPGSALRTVRLELDSGVEGAERRRDIGDVVLGPACTLVVRLVDPEGAPVEGGKVFIDVWAEGQPREMIERGGGEYVTERLRPCEYSVEAWASGWAPSEEFTELPREEPLEVRLEKGGVLKGTVRAATGEPIAGAKVTTRDDGLTFPVECDTDASGRFELRGFRAGLYEIGATAEGFHRAIWSVEDDDEVEIWLQREAIVEGKVLDEADGRPLAGVFIFLDPVEAGGWMEATTDARGEFLVRKIPPRPYKAAFHHDDYSSVHVGPWDLKPGETLSGVEVRLRRGFTARGKVVDAETGQPVHGASVSASRESDDGEPDVTSTGGTDGTGLFELRGLAPGEYAVSIEARGYLRAEEEVRIAPEEPESLSFALEKGASISGRVLDDSGRPLPRTQVYLYAPGDAPAEAMRSVRAARYRFSDAQGRFVLEGLHPFDDYGLLARDEDRGIGWLTGIAVGPRAKVTGLDIRFSPGGTVRGRVVDQAGRGTEGASVGLAPEDEGSTESDEPRWERIIPSYLLKQPSRWDRTTGDGSYEIDNVMPGLYRVSAAAPGWASQLKGPIRIGEGLVVEGMDFAFTGGATAAGRVVDGAGSGVGGVDIEVQVGSQRGRTTTDAAGQFTIMGLTAGRGAIHADKDGLVRASARVIIPSDDILLLLGARGKIAGRVEAPGRSVLPRGEISIWTFREGRDSAQTTAPTDEAGRFSASVEPGPSILLVAEIHGFGTSEVETSVEPGKRREVVIPIRRGGAIEGVVVSRVSGEPVEDAEVRLESRMSWTTLRDVVDADGKFDIDDVPEGPVAILARHGDHRSVRQEIHVIAGDTTTVRIELEGGQGIHGRVSRHGNALPGVRVAVLGTGGSAVAQVESGPGGLYEILGLAPGEYDVSVNTSGPDGRTLVLRRRVTVEAGRLTERDLDVGAVLVTGRVLRNGSPAADVDVAASVVGEDLGISTTDSSGEYSLELPGGHEVDLEIAGDGRTLAELVIELPEGPAELRRDIDLGAPSR
jgi:protocatechuate 3,4-dioxygenase beta subunit